MSGFTNNQKILAFALFLAFIFGLAMISFKVYQMTFVEYTIGDVGIATEEEIHEGAE